MKKTVWCVSALAETSPQAVPLGAACIASAVKNNPATKDVLDVRLASFSLEENDSRILEDKILETKDSIFAVCFSIYVWNRNVFENLAGNIKRKLPYVHLIAGGPEVTADPFSFKNFDWTVSGEGEGSVPLLLEKLLGSASETDFKIQGVYPKGCQEKEFCRSVSLPAEDLFSPWLDGTLEPESYGGVLWELARGCPFKCSYCYESRGEKKLKYFPEERIKKELELFAARKVPQVFVLDPTYNANKKRALDILRLIKQKTPETFFSFEARAEFIDRDLAKAFASIPCSLQFGLQSIHKNVLELINRSFDKKIFVRNISILNREGVVFGFDLIYGLPGDSLSGFKQSIDFALSLYPNNLELFCLSVLPGTELHDTAGRLGLIWEKDPPYHVISTRSFSESDMKYAEQLSFAVNIFYNKGRAVPWFKAVLAPLRMKPSSFFESFYDFLKSEDTDNISFRQLEQFQIKFVTGRYKIMHLEKMIPIVQDFISINNAISYFTAEGKESVVELRYHPDDLMSGYDISFLSSNCGHFKNRTKVFCGKNGADWVVLK